MNKKSSRFISASSGTFSLPEKYQEIDKTAIMKSPKNDSFQFGDPTKYTKVIVNSASDKITLTINVGMSAKGRVIKSAKDIFNRSRKISTPTDEVA